MIYTLLKNRSRFTKPGFWDEMGLEQNNYIVITLHRPSNVDEEKILKQLMNEIIENTRDLPLVFPVHPRTAKTLELLGIKDERLHIVDRKSVV